ncbi:MAG: SemiSWEET transporter [Flavobacterium sp. JAD_PAG50586_2]|nr:MAG: SemiSWEET transporter [Flavobacterium sp. JAD_PAG50586_2]
MDTTQLLGLLAAGFTTAANIPQTYVIIREKSARNISAVTYSLLLLGVLLWVVYGILKSDWPIIIANGISSLTSIMILILNFSTQKTINKIHDKVIPETVKKEMKKK